MTAELASADDKQGLILNWIARHPERKILGIDEEGIRWCGVQHGKYHPKHPVPTVSTWKEVVDETDK